MQYVIDLLITTFLNFILINIFEIITQTFEQPDATNYEYVLLIKKK